MWWKIIKGIFITGLCLFFLAVIVIVFYFSHKTIVNKHDPIDAMEEYLEDKYGYDFEYVEGTARSEDSFKLYKYKERFGADFSCSKSADMKVGCQAVVNKKKKYYDFDDNYMMETYRLGFRDEIEEVGEQIYHDKIEAWVEYDTGMMTDSDDELADYYAFTRSKKLNKKRFRLVIVIHNISDEEAIKATKELQKWMDENEILCDMRVVRNNLFTDEEYQKYYHDPYAWDATLFMEDIYSNWSEKEEISIPIKQEIRDKYIVYERHDKDKLLVVKEKGSERLGLVDWDGNILIPCGDYKKIITGGEGFYLMVSMEEGDNPHALCCIRTQAISDFGYISAADYGDFYAVSKDFRNADGWGTTLYEGATDLEYNEIIPFKYRRIEKEGNRIKATDYEDNVTYYDFEGNILK